MKINEKWTLFLIATFVTFFGVADTLLKGTQATKVVEPVDAVAAVNTVASGSMSILCPETAFASQEVECSIVFNSAIMTVQGINAKYNVSEGMEYVEFIPDAIWVTSNETNHMDSDGFALVSDGVTGNINVGTVKFTMPDTAESNEIYTVELIDVTLDNGDSDIVMFEKISDSVRIISDVNTLEGMTLSNGN